MAAYTASVTGNWADTATWGGSGPPGNGDTVTINDSITVTIPASTSVTVGASPDDDVSTHAISTTTAGGTGKLVINGTLIFRGTVRQGNTDWDVGPGAILEHDSSQATTPSSTHYSWRIGTSASTGGILSIRGVDGNRAIIRNAASSGRFAGFTSGGAAGRGCLDFEFVSVTDAGVAGSTPWSDSHMGYSGAIHRLVDCLFDGCAKTLWEKTIQMDADADVQWNRTTMKNGVDDLWLDGKERTGGIAFTGIREITDCVLEGSFDVTGFRNFTMDRTAVFGSPNVKVFNDADTGPSVVSWDDGMIVNGVSDAAGIIGVQSGGTISGVMAMRAQSGEHDFMRGTSGRSYDFNYSGSVLVSEDEADDGEWFIFEGSPSSIAVTISDNLILPAEGTGGPSANYITHASGASNAYQITAENNTYATTIDDAVTNAYFVQTESGGTISAGSFVSVQNNLIYNGGSVTRNDYITFDPVADRVADGCYTTADYNLRFNQSRTSAASGIYSDSSAKYSNTPGGNDLTADPQFVDDTFALSTWLTGIDSGVTTWDLWFDELLKLNDDSGYNADLHWMEFHAAAKAAFTPQNTALQGAGYDGSDIGAIAVAVSSAIRKNNPGMLRRVGRVNQLG